VKLRTLKPKNSSSFGCGSKRLICRLSILQVVIIPLILGNIHAYKDKNKLIKYGLKITKTR